MNKQVTYNQKFGFPALMSFLFPGLGQLIKGNPAKFISILILFVLSAITIIGPFIIWIWSVIDAYNVVEEN
jgi:TM2 domain-containing membrane protein YozV